MLPEEICLTSTPKRPSLPQSMATPAPVSMSESVETVEAKAALKQVHFSADTAHSSPSFFLHVVSTFMSVLCCSCRKFLRTIKKKRQRMTSC